MHAASSRFCQRTSSHTFCRSSGTAQLPEGTDVGRVRFKCADACNLPRDLAPVDAILAANLLCRLPDPASFLDRLPALLRPGGVVVLTTPWSWLEAWTKRPRWLGGCAPPALEIESLDTCATPGARLSQPLARACHLVSIAG